MRKNTSFYSRAYAVRKLLTRSLYKAGLRMRYGRGDGFVTKNFGPYTIHSHNIECIERSFRKIYRQSIYEFSTDEVTPYIIDGGANIGLGVLYWKMRYPDARIIAFEPAKPAFESLIRNVEYNGLTGVTCHNVALADKPGRVKFTTDDILSGTLRTEQSLDIDYEVEAVRLSSFLTDPVDLLKLDIEGAEKYVFPEITEHLHKIKRCFIEYHSFAEEDQYLASILSKLESSGFRYYIEGEREVTAPFSSRRISQGQDLQLNIWADKLHV